MGKFYRINQYITASQVRVVDETGKQIGVMAIFDAKEKARSLGVDLVEVAPNAVPPVCKIIDFKKFKYQEAKKEREEKKGTRSSQIKEIQLSPFIAKNDLDIRIKKATGFLKEGNKVKLRVRFRGRAVTKKEFGFKILNQIQGALAEIAAPETDPKSEGREITLTLSPVKGRKNEKQEKNQKIAPQKN